jgi:GAF domain-containing protein
MAEDIVNIESFLSSLGARRAKLENLVGAADINLDIGGFIGEITDLTEQLLVADEELRAQQAELDRSRAIVERLAGHTDRMFAYSTTPLLETDGHGIVVNSNQAARTLLGEAAREITAIRPIATKFVVSDRSMIRRLISAVAGGSTEQAAVATVRSRQGMETPVRVTVWPVEGIAGEEATLWWALAALTDGDLTVQRTPAPLATAMVVADLALQLSGQRSIDELLDRIVGLARGSVPGAEHAGVSVSRVGQGVATLAATDELVRACDRVQNDLGEGPCLDAQHGEQFVLVPDMESEIRWPAFAAAAREMGVRSMLACELPMARDQISALNFHASSPDVFTEESVAIGTAFAIQAGIALAAADREHHLQTAIGTREVIGQALGILMERYRVTATQAFDMLVHASQTRHVKLRDLARALAETGEL